jgi:hypothetical protein
MNEKRITIIPHIEGKITGDGKVSEPDIYWIMDKWLERHPEIKKRSSIGRRLAEAPARPRRHH